MNNIQIKKRNIEEDCFGSKFVPMTDDGWAIEKKDVCCTVLFPEIWDIIIGYSDPAFLLRSIAPIAKYFYFFVKENYSPKYIFNETGIGIQKVLHVDVLHMLRLKHPQEWSNILPPYMLFWIYKPGHFLMLDLAVHCYKEFGIRYDDFIKWIPMVRAYYGDLNTIEEMMMYSCQQRKCIYFYSIIGENSYFSSDCVGEIGRHFLEFMASLLCDNLEYAKPFIDRYYASPEKHRLPISILIKKKKLNFVYYILSKFGMLALNPKDEEYSMRAAVISNNIELMKLLVDCGSTCFKKNNEDLLIAIKNGNVKIVKYLLDNNVALEGSKNPLITASRHGHVEIATILLDNGVDINVEYKGYNLLDCACERGHKDIVQLLVERNISSDVIRSLRYSIRNGHLHIIKYFVEKGVSVEVMDLCFMWTIRTKYYELVQYFLTFEKIRSRLREIRKSSLSPLMTASIQNNIKIVKMLLAVDRNYIDDMFLVKSAEGATEMLNPLLNASKSGYFDQMKLLIKYGASLKLKTENGQTPFLLFLAANPLVDQIQYLLSVGACLEDTDYKGNHALMYLLVSSPNLASNLDYFKSLGYDFSIRNHENETALMAVLRESIFHVTDEKLVLLSRFDIPLDGVDKKGNTIFMYYTKNSLGDSKRKHAAAEKIIKLLITCGSDINYRNEKGETVLMLLHDECYNYLGYLVQAGANLVIEDNKGKNILIRAIEQSKRRIVDSLLRLGTLDIHEVTGCGLSAYQAAEQSREDKIRVLFNIGPFPDGDLDISDSYY